MKSKVLQIDEEFWFTAQYAASLLQTSKKKVEAMAVRDLIRARPEGNSFLIAEAEVTRLRRDPKALTEAKEASAMPAYPERGERMPSDTIYKDDPFPESVVVRPRIGHPLKDEGKV
jgi:hypothetical protein